MKIDLTDDYDRDAALFDADSWSQIRQAIDTVLTANASLESTGTLDYMPGMFDNTDIRLTPERRHREYQQKLTQIDAAVATIKQILLTTRDDAPTPEQIALAEQPGPYDQGIGIYNDD